MNSSIVKKSSEYTTAGIQQSQLLQNTISSANSSTVGASQAISSSNNNFPKKRGRPCKADSDDKKKMKFQEQIQQERNIQDQIYSRSQQLGYYHPRNSKTNSSSYNQGQISNNGSFFDNEDNEDDDEYFSEDIEYQKMAQQSSGQKKQQLQQQQQSHMYPKGNQPRGYNHNGYQISDDEEELVEQKKQISSANVNNSSINRNYGKNNITRTRISQQQQQQQMMVVEDIDDEEDYNDDQDEDEDEQFYPQKQFQRQGIISGRGGFHQQQHPQQQSSQLLLGRQISSQQQLQQQNRSFRQQQQQSAGQQSQLIQQLPNHSQNQQQFSVSRIQQQQQQQLFPPMNYQKHFYQGQQQQYSFKNSNNGNNIIHYQQHSFILARVANADHEDDNVDLDSDDGFSGPRRKFPNWSNYPRYVDTQNERGNNRNRKINNNVNKMKTKSNGSYMNNSQQLQNHRNNFQQHSSQSHSFYGSQYPPQLKQPNPQDFNQLILCEEQSPSSDGSIDTFIDAAKIQSEKAPPLLKHEETVKIRQATELIMEQKSEQFNRRQILAEAGAKGSGAFLEDRALLWRKKNPNEKKLRWKDRLLGIKQITLTMVITSLRKYEEDGYEFAEKTHLLMIEEQRNLKNSKKRPFHGSQHNRSSAINDLGPHKKLKLDTSSGEKSTKNTLEQQQKLLLRQQQQLKQDLESIQYQKQQLHQQLIQVQQQQNQPALTQQQRQTLQLIQQQKISQQQQFNIQAQQVQEQLELSQREIINQSQGSSQGNIMNGVKSQQQLGELSQKQKEEQQQQLSQKQPSSSQQHSPIENVLSQSSQQQQLSQQSTKSILTQHQQQQLQALQQQQLLILQQSQLSNSKQLDNVEEDNNYDDNEQTQRKRINYKKIRQMCLCGQPCIEGQVRLCDNLKCKGMWFHKDCIAKISDKQECPEDEQQWICPTCSQDPDSINLRVVSRRITLIKQRNKQYANGKSKGKQIKGIGNNNTKGMKVIVNSLISAGQSNSNNSQKNSQNGQKLEYSGNSQSNSNSKVFQENNNSNNNSQQLSQNSQGSAQSKLMEVLQKYIPESQQKQINGSGASNDNHMEVEEEDQQDTTAATPTKNREQIENHNNNNSNGSAMCKEEQQLGSNIKEQSQQLQQQCSSEKSKKQQDSQHMRRIFECTVSKNFSVRFQRKKIDVNAKSVIIALIKTSNLKNSSLNQKKSMVNTGNNTNRVGTLSTDSIELYLLQPKNQQLMIFHNEYLTDKVLSVDHVLYKNSSYLVFAHATRFTLFVVQNTTSYSLDLSIIPTHPFTLSANAQNIQIFTHHGDEPKISCAYLTPVRQSSKKEEYTQDSNQQDNNKEDNNNNDEEDNTVYNISIRQETFKLDDKCMDYHQFGVFRQFIKRDHSQKIEDIDEEMEKNKKKQLQKPSLRRHGDRNKNKNNNNTLGSQDHKDISEQLSSSSSESLSDSSSSSQQSQDTLYEEQTFMFLSQDRRMILLYPDLIDTSNNNRPIVSFESPNTLNGFQVARTTETDVRFILMDTSSQIFEFDLVGSCTSIENNCAYTDSKKYQLLHYYTVQDSGIILQLYSEQIYISWMFKDHKNTAVEKKNNNNMQGGTQHEFKSRALSFGRNFIDAIFVVVDGKILVFYIEEEDDMDEQFGGVYDYQLRLASFPL